MRTPRQIWLGVNEDWLTGDQDPAKAFDIFGIGDRALMMPSFIVPLDLDLDAAVSKLAPFKAGAVAMGYGTFWMFWETGDVLITAEEDADDSKSIDGKILDMHGGCYQLQEDGEWRLLGAS